MQDFIEFEWVTFVSKHFPYDLLYIILVGWNAGHIYVFCNFTSILDQKQRLINNATFNFLGFQ